MYFLTNEKRYFDGWQRRLRRGWKKFWTALMQDFFSHFTSGSRRVKPGKKNHSSLNISKKVLTNLGRCFRVLQRTTLEKLLPLTLFFRRSNHFLHFWFALWSTALREKQHSLWPFLIQQLVYEGIAPNPQMINLFKIQIHFSSIFSSLRINERLTSMPQIILIVSNKQRNRMNASTFWELWARSQNCKP